jgi:hypothetical protein
MTASDGDVDEMPVPPLDDRALDALLNGAPSAQSGLDWLLPFVEDLEKASQEPAPVVRPALALLLKEGFSPVNGAVVAGVPAPPRAVRRPVLRGALTRVAGLSLVAKVGLGAGVAAATTTAAGAAGVLPDPAQHAVAKVVSAATPFSFPDKAKAGHGRTVSSDATGASDGVKGVDGKAVSDAAKTPPGTPAGGPPSTAGNNGVGANTGATGLDRANETPAAGHVPTSVPGRGAPPVTPGKGANGQDPGNTTPAAGKGTTTIPGPAGPPATASPSGTNRGTTPTIGAADRPGGTVRP